MKKTILYALFVLIPFAASAQLDTVRQNEGNGRIYIKILDEGTIVEEGYHQDGTLDGAWTTYHSNGEPHMITVYNRGKKDGMCMKVNEEGRTEYLRHYKNDKLDGEQKTFNVRTGRPIEIENYAHGVKQGITKIFFENGNLREKIHYNNGVKAGKYEHYTESGKLVQEINYDNEDMDGSGTAYYVDGDVKEQGSYKNDKKSGFWKEYMHGGTREIEGNYVDGVKDGEWKEYLNGNLERTIVYKKGRMLDK